MCLINKNSLVVIKLKPCIKAQFIFQIRGHGIKQDLLNRIIILFLTLTQHIFLYKMLTFTFLWGGGRGGRGRLSVIFFRIQSSGLFDRTTII